MSYTHVKNTGRPGATFNLIDPTTGKVVATATADAKGVVNVPSVPPGLYKEQVIFTHPGDTKPTTITSPNATDFGAIQGTPGVFLQSPDGHIWQVQVSNAGTLSTASVA